jgi:hypothetical protein
MVDLSEPQPWYDKTTQEDKKTRIVTPSTLACNQVGLRPAAHRYQDNHHLLPLAAALRAQLLGRSAAAKTPIPRPCAKLRERRVFDSRQNLHQEGPSRERPAPPN